jgi:hypothetical protein
MVLMFWLHLFVASSEDTLLYRCSCTINSQGFYANGIMHRVSLEDSAQLAAKCQDDLDNNFVLDHSL